MTHFYEGNGRNVTLSQIGQLRAVAEYHAYGLGVFGRLPGQIARLARENPNTSLGYFIRRSYDFKPVLYSHGAAIVKIYLLAKQEKIKDMLHIEAKLTFRFDEEFKYPYDVLNLLEKPDVNWFGVPYKISGFWSGNMLAIVRMHASVSRYTTIGEEEHAPKRL